MFTPIEHPRPTIRDVGFDLEHRYLEQCWSAVIGPSALLLLRRLPTLWVTEIPAEIDSAEMARSLGLRHTTSQHGSLQRTMERLCRFGLARPSQDRPGLDVYRQIPILSPRELARVPQWTRNAHTRLFNDHLEIVTAGAEAAIEVPPVLARMDKIQPATHGSDTHTIEALRL